MPKLISKEQYNDLGTHYKYESMTLDEYITLVDEHHPKVKIEFIKHDLYDDEYVELMVNDDFAGAWFKTGICYIWDGIVSLPDQQPEL